MRYVTGFAALNTLMPDTDGDWHDECVDWEHPHMLESDDTPFGDENIVYTKVRGQGMTWCANHARACVDLMFLGKIGSLSNLRTDFINNEDYTEFIMRSAYKLIRLGIHVQEVDRVMGKAYRCDWLQYLYEQGDPRWTKPPRRITRERLRQHSHTSTKSNDNRSS